jgi:hypothetical protein
VLDVIGRWFRFNVSIMPCVNNLDRDIGGLFLLILHNGRHDRIVGQFRFNFTILSRVNNLYKDIGWLFLLFSIMVGTIG